MTAFTHRLAVAAALLVVIASHTVAQQPKQPYQEIIQTKLLRFTQYADDFYRQGRAASGNQWKAPSYLHDTAIDACGYLLAVRALLEMHDQLSCREDQGNASLIIARELRYYSQRLDVDMKKVNLDRSSAKPRAVARSAAQMNDELRELKAFFESIRSN